MADAVARHQARLLGDLYRTGAVPKDEYIAAILGVDRTVVVRWRSGERQAPLGILPMLLAEIDDPDARVDAVRALVAPLGLDVRRMADDGPSASLTDLVVGLTVSAGRVAAIVEDGRVDASEAAALTRTADRLEATATQLRALARSAQ